MLTEPLIITVPQRMSTKEVHRLFTSHYPARMTTIPPTGEMINVARYTGLSKEELESSNPVYINELSIEEYPRLWSY
jgi:hypothetical protein